MGDQKNDDLHSLVMRLADVQHKQQSELGEIRATLNGFTDQFRILTQDFKDFVDVERKPRHFNWIGFVAVLLSGLAIVITVVLASGSFLSATINPIKADIERVDKLSFERDVESDHDLEIQVGFLQGQILRNKTWITERQQSISTHSAETGRLVAEVEDSRKCIEGLKEQILYMERKLASESGMRHMTDWKVIPSIEQHIEEVDKSGSRKWIGSDANK